jgi:uncharacterized repeat protein (TIGR04076 family)
MMVDGDGIWRDGLWHDLPDIKVTVMRVMGSGKPPCEYKPGDTFTITAFKAPEGLCVWAISAILLLRQRQPRCVRTQGDRKEGS